MCERVRRLDDLLPMLRVARLFQPYQTDVIQVACLCWFGCGFTARKEQCNRKRGSNSRYSDREAFGNPRILIFNFSVFHVVFLPCAC